MFLAHKNDIAPNTIHPLSQTRNRKFIKNHHGVFQMGSNICPHQGSLLSCKPQQHLQCQYHGWTWDQQGAPVNGGSTNMQNNTAIKLHPVYEYQGLLFDQTIDIPMMDQLDFSNFQLMESRMDTVMASGENIMNLFLDVDHIPVVHASVYDEIGIVGAADVEWVYFKNGSMQKVKHHVTGEWAAVWIAVYPGTMIEWQPGAMFITVATTLRDWSTQVAVFKYRDLSQDNYHKSASIWETAWGQDKQQAEAMVGTAKFQNLEAAKQHFFNWSQHAIRA